MVEENLEHMPWAQWKNGGQADGSGSQVTQPVLGKVVATMTQPHPLTLRLTI